MRVPIAQAARINGAPPLGDAYVIRPMRRLRSSKKKVAVDTLLKRDGILCQICYRPFTSEWPPTIDHIIEISAGGTNHLSNLRLAHVKCNKLRSTDPRGLEYAIQMWYRYGLYE